MFVSAQTLPRLLAKFVGMGQRSCLGDPEFDSLHCTRTNMQSRLLCGNGFLSKLNTLRGIDMKTAKLTLMFLACAAAIPAFAQNTTDSRCGSTNYDRSRNEFTITNPTPGTATQQCFITVVPKQSWSGGVPDLSSSQLVEGNYEITLSGGGGGGGAADTERGRHRRTDDSAKDDAERGRLRRTDDSARDDAERGRHHRTEAGAGGSGGYSAIPVTKVRYLNPGVYRLTIGSGGQGGMAGPSGEHMARSGGRGADGAPTSLSNANTGETVAGFARAETWDGTYPLVAQGAYAGTPANSGERGGGGTGGKEADRGAQGGNGFIKLALKDPVPQAAPVQAAPARSETVTTPAPAASRPARRDRN
jgi:hypothetical protein